MVCVVVVGVGPLAAEVEVAVPALLVGGAAVVDAGATGVVVPQAVIHNVAVASPEDCRVTSVWQRYDQQ